MIKLSSNSDRQRRLSDAHRHTFGAEAAERAARDMAIWFGLRRTPLHSLEARADSLGIAGLYVKDEGQRLGLGSFKALGGAYAVFRLVLEAAEKALGRALDARDISLPEVREVAAGITVACATDGNHGRSVAMGATAAGCRSVIFVHEGVDPERIEAIADRGAEIVRVQGNYDDAVAAASSVSARQGWTVVSDTSWPGYEHVPSLVMQGYTVLVKEVLAALAEPPTHVFLQAGVGGFAAAVAAHLNIVLAGRSPLVVVVEPNRAACLYESNLRGKLTGIEPGEATCMAMLECYEPSMIAWSILRDLADAFVTLEEGEAVAAMNMLARPEGGDPAIVAGESGGVGLAALIKLLDDEPLRRALRLGADARVLLINTEGATAPARYVELTGLTEDQVRASRLGLAAG